MNFDDENFKILLASCCLKLSYHESINLPTNTDSAAAILAATIHLFANDKTNINTLLSGLVYVKILCSVL